MHDFNEVFEDVDLIVSPMSPSIAFKKGFFRNGRYHGNSKTDKYRQVVDMAAQLPALCGFPGISIPCGFVRGLPVGLNIYGPALSEQNILNAAYAYEQRMGWYKISHRIN